jgi:ABC-type multidrug transport system fused ATPase/permease subunit
MLKDIFWGNKRKILFTYFILIFEFVIFAMIPYLLGKAIDGVVANDNQSFFIYLSLLLFGLVIGFGRRIYDTVVYSRIWADKVKDTVKDLKDRNVNQPKIVSRYRLLFLYSDFFEHTIPSSISSFVEIVVALVMLALVVPLPIFGCVLSLAIIAMTVYYIISCYTQRVETDVQHLKEKIDAEIIENGAKVDEDVDKLADRYIVNSNLDALGWGIQDILSVVAEVIVIFAIVGNDATVGTIMATLTYVWKLFCHTGCLSDFFYQTKKIQMANKFLKDD